MQLESLEKKLSIKVARDVLRNSMSLMYLINRIRDLRRVITHGYLIDLGSGPLPKVKGGDDAADCLVGSAS